MWRGVGARVVRITVGGIYMWAVRACIRAGIKGSCVGSLCGVLFCTKSAESQRLIFRPGRQKIRKYAAVNLEEKATARVPIFDSPSRERTHTKKKYVQENCPCAKVKCPALASRTEHNVLLMHPRSATARSIRIQSVPKANPIFTSYVCVSVRSHG